MTDSGSSYLNNAALDGGVFYLDYSSLTLSDATMDTNYAVNGGIFSGYDKTPLVIDQTTVIINTITLGKGGIGYFNENPAFSSTTDTFTISISDTTVTSSASDLEGGSFYINTN